MPLVVFGPLVGVMGAGWVFWQTDPITQDTCALVKEGMTVDEVSAVFRGLEPRTVEVDSFGYVVQLVSSEGNCTLVEFGLVDHRVRGKPQFIKATSAGLVERFRAWLSRW
jgi:hypothetical protein